MTASISCAWTNLPGGMPTSFTQRSTALFNTRSFTYAQNLYLPPPFAVAFALLLQAHPVTLPANAPPFAGREGEWRWMTTPGDVSSWWSKYLIIGPLYLWLMTRHAGLTKLPPDTGTYPIAAEHGGTLATSVYPRLAGCSEIMSPASGNLVISESSSTEIGGSVSLDATFAGTNPLMSVALSASFVAQFYEPSGTHFIDRGFPRPRK